MRLPVVLSLLLLFAAPALAEQTVPTADVAKSDQARWAEIEAQARIAEGDYDGALQAQQQADADRDDRRQHEQVARGAKR